VRGHMNLVAKTLIDVQGSGACRACIISCNSLSMFSSSLEHASELNKTRRLQKERYTTGVGVGAVSIGSIFGSSNSLRAFEKYASIFLIRPSPRMQGVY